MRATSMPSTVALSVFCATACMARPVTVFDRNAWVANTSASASTKVPTSDSVMVTPAMLKESAYGLGSTTWEVVSRVVLPYTKAGVVGGIMLGLGRALGETMAVTFVIGNMNQLDSLSLFEAANSITSALANEFAEAGEGLHQASLIYLGLVLFFITFVVLALSKWLLSSLQKGEGKTT